MSSTTAFDTELSAPSRSIEDLTTRLGHGPLVLLAVWAHPDDESYLGAGLMAEVARRGGTVVSVTATLGEHGTADPEAEPPAQLAARRRAELDRALTVLGARGTALGYADGSCDAVPEALGARRIGALIHDLQPDVVVGFGSDGVTGHPDHRAVARWTRRAVDEAGADLPLLTSAAGAAWPADLLDRMHRTGAFWPGYPERKIPGPTWTAEVLGQRLDQKLAALGCHESQIDTLRRTLGVDDYRRLASVEAYRAANPAAEQLLSNGRGALAS